MFRGMLLFVLVAGAMCVNTQKLCYTPHGSLGQCVPYSRCSYFKMQLEEFGGHVPPKFRDYMKSSLCYVPNAREIFLCCEDIFIEHSTTTTTTPARAAYAGRVYVPAVPAISIAAKDQHFNDRFRIVTRNTSIPTTFWVRVATTTPARARIPQRKPDGGNQQVNERGLQVLKGFHCGEIKGPRISHAKKTKLNEFRFMALLKYDDFETWKCGGTLITSRFVITVAHCWIGQRKSPYAVRLGEHDYSTDKDCEKRGRRLVCNPPPVDYGIKQLIAHPSYKPRQIHHDIGLIRLDRKVKFDVHIQPVCLPIYPESLVQTDPRYILAGWGTPKKSPASSLLRKAVIPARKISYCQNIFTTYSITDHHICAGGGGNVDSCKGDSGGPLFYEALYKEIPRYVQFGIVSKGVRSCVKGNYPTVYTKIAPYLPWITDIIAQYDV